MTEAVRDIEVRDDGIRLGQLLKLAGMVESGAAAKALLEAGVVTVDGQVETRRGRRLQRGAVVGVEGEVLRLV